MLKRLCTDDFARVLGILSRTLDAIINEGAENTTSRADSHPVSSGFSFGFNSRECEGIQDPLGEYPRTALDVFSTPDVYQSLKKAGQHLIERNSRERLYDEQPKR